MKLSKGKVSIGVVAIVGGTIIAVATAVAIRTLRATAVPQTPRAIAPAKQPSPALAPRNDPPHISYEKIPMSFEPNLGQSDPRVKFLSRGPGYTLFLTPAEAVIAMRQSAPDRARGRGPTKLRPLAPKNHLSLALTAGSFSPTRGEEGKPAVVRIALTGASHAPKVSGIEALPGRSNYFIGSDPKKWHTDVPNYAKVELKDVYPGIDLIYHGSEQGQLEYDFRLAPGANPEAIRLGFKGAGKLALDERGNLVVKVGDQKLIQHAPVIYQESVGGRRTVAGGWRLRGAHEAAFRVASYYRSRPIVIDPVLVYSTYLGGSGVCDANRISGQCQGDSGGGFHIDSSGNVYVSGTAYSTDFPTSAGAFQKVNHGAGNHTSNVFVTKLNAAGSVLIYSTYLGGSGVCDASGEYCQGDFGEASYVDSSGNVYVSGGTYSTDFPTLHAFQTANRSAGIGGSNMFITKLSSAGSGLIYSTYLGGSGVCDANGICSSDEGSLSYVDSSGNAYVSGTTHSTDFPTTAGAFQTSNNAAGNHATNVFVTKLNPGGSGLIYSTYLGGSGVCFAPGFCSSDEGGLSYVDSSGNAFVSGISYSTDFPTTPGAFQSTNNAAGNLGFNAFVTKLNPDGSGLVYSTYLGGSGLGDGSGDLGFLDYVDSSGNAYVSGGASSTDFPTTLGAYQTTNNAAANHTSNAFVTKLNATGSELIYSTYLGGSGSCVSGVCSGDGGFLAYVDPSGNAYLSGEAYSTDFPTTAGAFQVTNNGAANNTFNAFITKLNAEGSGLLYSTYLGGSGVCDADGISGNCQGDFGGIDYVDSSGNTWVSGKAYSTDFPTTAGAFQTTNNAAANQTFNAFITKLNAEGSGLLYSTYLGGSGVCDADGISGNCQGDLGGILYVDSSGNVYVSGYTYSTDFPHTAGAFQGINHAAGIGGSNVFVAKLALGAVGSSPTPTATPTGATPTSTPTGIAHTATPTPIGVTPTLTPTPTSTGTPTSTATPVPEHLTVTPTNHNFGKVRAETQSKPVKITVSNTGGQDKKHKLPVLIEMVDGAANYAITSNNCPSILGFKQSCLIEVACIPPAKGPVPKGTMLIVDNAIGTPQKVTLTCKGK